ncbi:MAG: single-stranded DNA-binding protein [Saprospiraceae bacterium]|nr:single-stranded DNA-binding protein [Saprospiraceae bacterium]
MVNALGGCLAMNENYGEKGKDTQPQWHNLVAWDGKAEFASQYLKKATRDRNSKADYRIAVMKRKIFDEVYH